MPNDLRWEIIEVDSGQFLDIWLCLGPARLVKGTLSLPLTVRELALGQLALAGAFRAKSRAIGDLKTVALMKAEQRRLRMELEAQNLRRGLLRVIEQGGNVEREDLPRAVPVTDQGYGRLGESEEPLVEYPDVVTSSDPGYPGAIPLPAPTDCAVSPPFLLDAEWAAENRKFNDLLMRGKTE